MSQRSKNVGVDSYQSLPLSTYQPQGKGLIDSDPPLGGELSIYQPYGAGLIEGLIPIEKLTELRHRLNTGVSWCNARANTPKATSGRQRLMRIAAREYLPAIHRWRSAHSRDEITQARDAVLERLERGWETPNAPAEDSSTDRRAELFADLLTQYEVFEDMLSEHVIANTMDRVLCG